MHEASKMNVILRAILLVSPDGTVSVLLTNLLDTVTFSSPLWKRGVKA
jgi:hypothetical protein